MNVTLPPTLITDAQHHSKLQGISLSALVETALRNHLYGQEESDVERRLSRLEELAGL